MRNFQEVDGGLILLLLKQLRFLNRWKFREMAVRPRVLKDIPIRGYYPTRMGQAAPHIGERRLPRIVWGKGTRTVGRWGKIAAPKPTIILSENHINVFS